MERSHSVLDPHAELVPPPPPPGEPSEPPAKRRRVEDNAAADDALRAALRKIGSHIGNPKKFVKASVLLRQLLQGEKLTKAHGDMVFAALRAAMEDPSRAQEPGLLKEYVKLFTVASNASQLFTGRQKGQLDVYGLQAVLRNQLHTDDSFVLNRVLGRVKESILHLADVTEEDDATLEELQAWEAKEKLKEAEAPGPVEGAEDDPFNLSAVEADLAEPKRLVWSMRESLCMKRGALVDCLEAAKLLHDKPWARTSIDIAIEEAHKQREKFCTSQRPRLDDLAQFVKRQRALRQQGGEAARDNKRDRTSFEEARKEWSKATLSIRGAVGAQGDHHSEVWLG